MSLISTISYLSRNKSGAVGDYVGEKYGYLWLYNWSDLLLLISSKLLQP